MNAQDAYRIERDQLRAQVEHLKGLVRTAHDNADYIADLARNDNLQPAVVLVKAEGIMALADQMNSWSR